MPGEDTSIGATVAGAAVGAAAGVVTPKPKKKNKPVPVGQNKQTQTPKKEENPIDRVKKTYKEKGFWAAAGQYFKEAFAGPPATASEGEREARRTAETLAGLSTLSFEIGPY